MSSGNLTVKCSMINATNAIVGAEVPIQGTLIRTEHHGLLQVTVTSSDPDVATAKLAPLRKIVKHRICDVFDVAPDPGAYSGSGAADDGSHSE